MRTLLKSLSGRASSIAAFVAAEAAISTLTASSALAQQVTSGAGGDAPFAPGVVTGLNWVHFLGAAIAVVAFLVGCILLFTRNVMGAGAAFLFVIVGAAFMANANSIITTLSGLGFA
jgi:hypothetical protein